MKLIAESGLWSTGPLLAPTPLIAVLEVSGAVLSWVIDEEPAAAAITFTDLARADWLWRLLGESGHSAVAAAVDGRLPDEAQAIDVNGVGVLPGSVDQLRRLALGHWMRRWWPASHRDGIAVLDNALLDAEIALLTSAAEDFFADDTFDSDVAGLLAAHSAALNELAEPVAAALRRDDYALAAGAQRAQTGAGVIARGTASLNWAAVAPALFDAAENTVDWAIEPAESGANAVVAVQLLGSGSAEGVAVRLRSGVLAAEGVLDRDGRVVLPLVDAQQRPVTESAAWNHDWQATMVTVGADVDESTQTRDRVRDFARARLATPAPDAFLAEILAAESDY